MYFRPLSLIQFTLLFLLLVNAMVWFFSLESFCQSVFSNEATKRRREGSRFYENLTQLHGTILRMKKSEVAVDRLLSRYARKNLGKNLPTIYCITPTYARLTQKADLTRLCQTLQHVWNFHWIVVEDSEYKTNMVTGLLERCGVTYTHLAMRTSVHLRRKDETPSSRYTWGMEQRNKGLDWVRRNFDAKRMKGVVYFADDDNTYDVEIFKKIRETKAVSVWPVGLVGGLCWAGPICKDNAIVNFHVAFKPNREFPVDMEGFAINAKLVVMNPRLQFYPNRTDIGRSESSFLAMVTTRDKLEPLGDLCTKVLVWHTRTMKPKIQREVELEGKSFPDIVET